MDAAPLPSAVVMLLYRSTVLAQMLDAAEFVRRQGGCFRLPRTQGGSEKAGIEGNDEQGRERSKFQG
jgi:hypothetical protein